MSIFLVTVYQVIGDDDGGNHRPVDLYFGSESEAFEKSKPYTLGGGGHKPRQCEGVKFHDGTIRLLGDVVISPFGTGEEARKAEREAARKKLTLREQELLGIRS